MPTEAERASHDASHCPYQAWCRSCVAGRGKADAHFARESDEDGVACVACDYCFMGEMVEDEKLSSKCLPIIVHKFYQDRWVTAHVVRAKGADEQAVKAGAEDLEQSGLQRFIYKSDGERAIVAYKAAVSRKLREKVGDIRIQPEESGVGESQSNAVVERAIWDIESMARTLVHAAKELHGCDFPLQHSIRVFAIEYAAQLLNRGQKAIKDNRTAYELRKGRPYRRKLPRYSEAVGYLKVAQGRRRMKFEDRWSTGIYLGLVERSNMVIVGTPEGIRKVNCVKRLPDIQSSDRELVLSIKGYPWCHTEGVDNEPGDVPALVATEPIVAEEDLPPRLPGARAPETIPRNVYLRRDIELKNYGFTTNCKGCDAARAKAAPRQHSGECRTRIEERMRAGAAEEAIRVETARFARDGGQAAEASGPRRPQILPVGEVLGQEPVAAAAPPSATVRAAPSVARPEEVRPLPEAKRLRADESAGVRAAPSSASDTDLPPVPDDEGDITMSVGAIAEELKYFGAVVGPSVASYRGRLAGVRAAPSPAEASGNEINELEISMVRERAIVSEVFCKNRFTSVASKFGLHPGYALDLTTGWDLDDPIQEKGAFELQETVRPYLLVGSPDCAPWSQLMGFGTGAATQPERMEKARRHLNISCQMYNRQFDEGRHFLHEHPHGARSWQEQCIIDLTARDGVYWVRNDQCETGQTAKAVSGAGILPARKTTGWLTDVKYIAEALAKFQCRNRGEGYHEHAHLISGRAKGTEEYQPILVAAVLRGLRRQLQEEGILSLNALEPGATGHDVESIPEEDVEKFYDDSSGEMLPAVAVRKARREEIDFLNRFPVYRKVPAANAKGKQMVSTRWCDVNKGDSEKLEVRSRLVGREFKWQNPFMQGTFAATPPLEGLRYLFHWVQTKRRRRGVNIVIKILILDVSRAHFHPPAVRELYIRLPDEDYTEGMVGLLLRTLYGTRDAANQWDEFANDKVAALGFDIGLSSPCLYKHQTEAAIGWRHGDDLAFAGEPKFLEEIYVGLSKDMVLKKRALLGFERGDDKHITILNRLVDMEVINGVQTITYEPDPRHVDLVIKHMSMIGSKVKSVSTPGEKRGDYHDQTSLDKAQATMYRSCTMRIAYLSADLPHLQHSSNRMARGMSSPTVGHWNRLKRACRYLAGHGRWVQRFTLQEGTPWLDIYTDSDWASDPIDRKSVTCIVAMVGDHMIKTQVATQTTPALSSGEAEYVANVKGGSLGIGLRSMAADYGDEMKVRIHTDSSASKGIAQRIGLGKVRHLDVALLWLQHHINRQTLRIAKVPGKENLADIGTKDLEEALMRKFMKAMGFVELEGRHSKALAIADGLSGTGDDAQADLEGLD